MKYFKILIGIFAALAASRFVPHPPNFTSLLALSFYVPAILGLRYLPALLVSFVITDILIGIHSLVIFTWGSVMFIGLLSQYFTKNFKLRISGALVGACFFYLITNFGVWSMGTYGYSFEGLILCYTLAIPFFGYSLISTFIFSVVIECLLKLNFLNLGISK